ncbi:MAG TPA: SDR family oxidoreductase [bacterium]|nr:SDR family oxidoreductase [bacterium]
MPKQIEIPPSPLTGKTAAITGGAGELCGAMADALARAGARVAVIDIDGARARAKADGIVKAGGRAIGIAADVVSRPDMDQAAGAIGSEFGGLDILINGAGGNNPGATTSEAQTFFDLPVDAVRKVFELNCLGTIVPCQALGKLIVETVKRSGDFGHIINLSSMNALRPLTRIPAYSAAKAAVSNFTQWLAVHMAQNYTPKIRVNAIAPGFFLTNQNRFLLIDQDSGGFTARGQTILAHTPAGELGRAEDLLSTLFWLLDPASRFISGVVVPVDGAFSAFSGV